MGMTELSRSILRTVVVFDTLDTPLTPLEIWRYLVAPTGFAALSDVSKEERVAEPCCSFREVVEALREDPLLRDRVEEQDGYIGLRGRVSELVAMRHAGARFAMNHWRILKKWGKRFRLVPFLRLFSACNFLAIDKVHAESDIDLYLVAEKGRLWFVRFVMNILALLRGDRITDDHRAEKLCLSFNATVGEAQHMLPLTLAPRDPYFTLWTNFVRPVLDRGSFSEFRFVNQHWVSPSLPHTAMIDSVPGMWGAPASAWRERVRLGLERVLSGRLGDWAERSAKATQLRHLRAQGRDKNNGTNVVITDDLLKFHSKDGRAAYREKIERLSGEYGLDTPSSQGAPQMDRAYVAANAR